jgi:serine/threonine-protein kinase
VESDDPKGRVVETDPAYPNTLPTGSTVTVSFSDGPEEIPDVVDLSQEDAEQAIRDAGFVPDVITDANSTKPAGTVFRQSPAAGEPAAEGTTVTIVVSAPDESPTEDPTESPSESPTESPTVGTSPNGQDRLR